MSEDCLNLNVWTPAALSNKPTNDAPRVEREKLPVMVWLHGGGFIIGSGAIHKVVTTGPMPVTNFTELARQGVVVVSLNYRLGRLGVFAHPSLAPVDTDEPRANYGFLDQQAALRWVKRNIEVFGGDPTNVTLFGQSAGAVYVNMHMISPLSEELFHKAIAQSGPTMRNQLRYLDRDLEGRSSLLQDGVQWAESLGIAADNNAASLLRALPMEHFTQLPSGSSSAPVVDGQLLSASVAELFQAGKQHAIPYIAGANSWDASVFAANPSALDNMVATFDMSSARTFYPDTPDTLFKQALISDMFQYSAAHLVQWMRRKNIPSYLYRFSYVPPSLKKKVPGAAHSEELAYVFRNLGARDGLEVVVSDRRVSDIISRYWTNFAKHGNPNGEALPQWRPQTDDQVAFIDIGEKVAMRTSTPGKQQLFQHNPERARSQIQ